MYISKIDLDTRRHETAKAVYNPAIFHGALERSFEGDRQHPLWRIEQANGNTSLLIVSKDKPIFTSLVKQFGFTSRPAQIKDYDIFLEKGIQTGDILRFRIVANPTIKINGKRVPLNMKNTENYPRLSATDWLRDRLEKNGALTIDVQINSYSKKTAVSKDKKVYYIQATYDGTLKIKDRKKFVELLKNGIGHEKAYGCGLVTVMKA